MEGLGLTAFDAVALAIVLISAVMAFARGLIREVFSIVAFFAAIFAAIWGYRHVAPMLEGAVGNPLFATLFAGFLIFLVVFVAITVLTSMLAKAAHSSGEIGTLDRGAGLLFGAARGILIVSLFVLLVRAVTGPPESTPQAATPSWMVEARLYPFFGRTASVLEGLGPRARTYMQERRGASDDPADPAPAN
ncbi:MAG: CvpA family protein [Hyphomonadaceae bacterium]|nr:CvpA family protein [Hyphomonadaceae bacterium]